MLVFFVLLHFCIFVPYCKSCFPTPPIDPPPASSNPCCSAQCTLCTLLQCTVHTAQCTVCTMLGGCVHSTHWNCLICKYLCLFLYLKLCICIFTCTCVYVFLLHFLQILYTVLHQSGIVSSANICICLCICTCVNLYFLNFCFCCISCLCTVG